MPQLRQDIVTGKWVIIATERARRPRSFSETKRIVSKKKTICPFCYGNEYMTPLEVLAFRDNGEPNSSGWKVRVVPNKFPALLPEGKPELIKNGIYFTMNGVGAHEVIIHSPNHDLLLPLMNEKQIELVLKSYLIRYKELSEDPNLKFIHIIVNHGKEAGASLDHPHSQLFGLPIVPNFVLDEIDGLKRYFDKFKKCVFCEIIKKELQDGKRIIEETDKFIAFEPFASKLPFETWIIPKKHMESFSDMGEDDLVDCSKILRNTMKKIYDGLNDPPLNYWLHSAPLRNNHKHYHWHFEIIPKLTKTGGFELGTGTIINTTLPEECAKYLRNFNK